MFANALLNTGGETDSVSSLFFASSSSLFFSSFIFFLLSRSSCCFLCLALIIFNSGTKMLRSSSSKSLMHQAQIKVEHSDSGLRLSVGLEDLVLGSSVDWGLREDLLLPCEFPIMMTPKSRCDSVCCGDFVVEDISSIIFGGWHSQCCHL